MPSSAGDVGDVADGVHAGEAVDASGRAVTSIRPPRPGVSPALCAIGRRGLAAAPDHGPGRDASSRRRARPGRRGRRPRRRPSRIVAPRLGQLLVRVLVGLLGERRRAARRPRSTSVIRPGTASCPVARQRVHQLGQRAGRSRPRSGRRRRRRRRACRRSAGRPIAAASQQVLQVAPQPFGVGDRVEREGVLGRARVRRRSSAARRPPSPGATR